MLISSLLILFVEIMHCVELQEGQFLAVEGDSFVYNGEQVYLSGTNAAWVHYGYDFGNNGWDDRGNIWSEELAQIGEAGGNSVRVWVHVEGDVSPLYDGDGFVIATDRDGTLISDLTAFLDECAKNDIFMGLVLFNGAVLRNQNTINLFWDDSKLETYLSEALVPMVKSLKDHPALGFWEVMNEAEGSSPAGQSDSDPCFDFTHLDWSRQSSNSSDPRSQGPGWSGADIPIKNILHLHNWVADTIHREDPKALVSTGSWSSLASTFVKGDDPVHKSGFNHYSDECLMKAGGREQGMMDFVQFHAYPWDDSWGSQGPWPSNTPEDYGIKQPVLVGEFPAEAFETGNGGSLPNGDSTEDLVEYLYTHGYGGGFTWAYIQDEMDTHPGLVEDIQNGLRQLQGRTEHGKVDVEINKQ